MKEYQNKEYLEKCLEQKMTIKQIALNHQVNFTTVFQYVKKFALKFPKKRASNFHKGETRIGERIGKMVITQYLGYRGVGTSRTPYFKYKCDCGREKEIAYCQLKIQRSCGCINYIWLDKDYEKETLFREDQGAFDQLYSTYRIGAIKRQKEFSLSKVQFAKLISLNCHYCGIVPSNILNYIKKTKTYPPCIYNGIDRIDNNKGYIIDNCITCCTTCNRAKRSMSLQDFEEWIKRIINHNRNGNS